MYANGVEKTANLTDAACITLGGKAATDPNTNSLSSSQAVDGLVYYTASNKPLAAPANAIGVMRETVNDTPVFTQTLTPTPPPLATHLLPKPCPMPRKQQLLTQQPKPTKW